MCIPSDCTCYQIWGSILPPPPCPEHDRPLTWSISGLRRACQGRHCAHGSECGTYYLRNGGLNG